MREEKEVKKITVEYTDGSKKDIDRGVVLSLSETDGILTAECDGVAGREADELAVVAIMASVAKDMGISGDLCERVEGEKR